MATKYSSANHLNEVGQVAGVSYRYNNPIRGINGYSTWLYSNGTTTRIGLVDAEHTGSYGYQHSTLRKLNEAGQVAGTSVRYDSNTGSYHGSSAWLYHNDTTTRIGFADAQHTDQNGYQDSSIQALNGAGQVAGTSSRYDSITGSNIGRSAWLYHNDTTTRVGLVDAGHTGNNGTQISQIQALNDAGQAAGFSTQYDSTTGNSIGNTTWLFDSTLEQTFIIDVTAQPNGSSNSTIHYLGDDGLVLGYYKKYSSDGIFRNNSPFAFTIEDGFVDLLDLAQQGTAQAAWGTLEQVYWNQDHSKVLGFRFTSGATLANTVIPIPASLWLFGSGLVGLMAVSRRKSNTGKHPEQGS